MRVSKFNAVSAICVLGLMPTLITASCEENLAFYPPDYNNANLTEAFTSINASLYQQLNTEGSSNSSVVVQISSSNQTLWSAYYNNGSSQSFSSVGTKAFRIASNTKLFTSLAILQLHAAGKLELDRSIVKYLPNLTSKGESNIQWDKISVRSLLTHAAGLPDNYGYQDLFFSGGQSLLDFPTPSNATIAALPECEQDSNVTCTSSGMVSYLQTAEPVLPPNTESSYSNVGFNLLGMIVSAVSGFEYQDYLKTMISGPLNLTDTTFDTPAPADSIIPAGDSQYGQDLGSDNASGGLYSSANDMTKFLQYCLLNHNTISPTVDWFDPQTYSAGSHSYFGIPWEIFRTTDIIKDNNRPTTFVTKGGGLLGYYSYTVIVPDYDLTIVILLAGNVAGVPSVLDAVTVPLVRGADTLVRRNLVDTYSGTFTGKSGDGSNFSMVLSQSTSYGVYVNNFTADGNDLDVALQTFAASQAGVAASDVIYQVVPTLRSTSVFRNGQNLTGEYWRMVNMLDLPASGGNDTQVWDDYCVTNIDPFSYVGQPINQVIFWKDADGKLVDMDLTAWNVTLDRS